MGAHSHPQSANVHSSPASVRHHQTRDHTRTNPHLSVKYKAPTDRQNMMSDAINTSIPLLFDNMMKIYFPSVDSDGFDKAFPQDKIGRISTKLADALKDKPVDPTDKRHYLKEKLISEAWVSLFGCLLPRNPRSQRSVATARG